MISEEDVEKTFLYARKVASGEIEPVESMGSNVALCALRQMVALLDSDAADHGDSNLADVGAVAWLALTKRSVGALWQLEFCKLLAADFKWPQGFPPEKNAHYN